MLVGVQHLQSAGRLVDRGDAEVAGAEQCAQLVAHEIDDGLVVQLSGDALLHAVDQRQLGSVPGHLALKPVNDARIAQCHGSLRRQHCKQVTVSVVEAPAWAFDVGVEKAQQLFACHQGRDQAAALVAFPGTFGSMPKGGGSAAARFFEPGGDGMQQLGVALSLRQQRVRDFKAHGRVQHQEHAASAAEGASLLDQESVQFRDAALLVQAQSGIDQPLERCARQRVVSRTARPRAQGTCIGTCVLP